MRIKFRAANEKLREIKENAAENEEHANCAYQLDILFAA